MPLRIREKLVRDDRGEATEAIQPISPPSVVLAPRPCILASAGGSVSIEQALFFVDAPTCCLSGISSIDDAFMR